MDLIVDFPRERLPRTPNPNDGAPPRLRVSFARQVEVRGAENLSVEHKDDLWFTEDEMTSFKCDLTRTLQRILSSGVTVAEFAERNVHDTSAFLGMEGYLSPDTPAEIRHRRKVHWQAVLFEQRLQRDAGVRDPRGMADVAAEVSEFSRRRARIVGLLHAPEKK